MWSFSFKNKTNTLFDYCRKTVNNRIAVFGGYGGKKEVGGSDLYFYHKNRLNVKFGCSRAKFQVCNRKSVKGWSNGHDLSIQGSSLLLNDSPKLFLDLYLIHKIRNVKFMIYLELSFFLCHLADFDWSPQLSQAIYSYRINSCWSTFTKFKSQ